MKPVPFDYSVPAQAAEAVSDTAQASGASKFVSGNQSLGPMLNLRLVRTSGLVDVSRLPELRRVEEAAGKTFIGAAITHAEIEDGEVSDPTGGWLRAAAANIAYRAVRNRGTIGGSLCHADPAADWVIVMTGLDATAVVFGHDGQHRIPISEFISGPFSTTLNDAQLLLGVEVTTPGQNAKWGYWKYMRQVGEFAKASATVYDDPERGICRCTIGALGRNPLILEDSKSIIAGTKKPADALREALPNSSVSDTALHITALKRALEIANREFSE